MKLQYAALGFWAVLAIGVCLPAPLDRTQDIDDDDNNSKKPSILFLMSDSHDGRTLDPTDTSVYPAQSLPNLNRLAQRGTNFVRAYTNSPQCSPSRSSMYTGRRTDQIKVWFNGVGLAGHPSSGRPAEACTGVYERKVCERWAASQNVSATFNDTLSDAGYNVSILGKTHIGADIRGEGPVGFDPPSSFAGTLLRAAGVLKPTTDWRETAPNGSKVVANTSDPLPPWRYNGKTDKDPNTLAGCVHLLQSLPSPLTTPQLLHCSFYSPHPPFDTNATFLDQINASKVSMPPLPDPDAMHPADHFMSVQKLQASYNVSGEGGAAPTRVTVQYSEDEVRLIILDQLDQRPDAADWYIIYTSDHGEMQMEHHQTLKNSLYEGPSIPQGVVNHDLVSLIDVYPTLCDMATVPKPQFLEGHSLLPLSRDEWRPAGAGHRSQLLGRNDRGRVVGASDRPYYVLSQYHSTYSVTGAFMVRRGSFKLIVYGGDPEEFPPQLFNVDEDPMELHNLAQERPELVGELVALLEQHMDWRGVDAEAKAFQRGLYVDMVWTQGFNRTGGCTQALGPMFHDFDNLDSEKISKWSGMPCQA